MELSPTNQPTTHARLLHVSHRVAMMIGLSILLLTAGATTPAGPPQEVVRRLHECPPGDAAALLDIAQFAIENDLLDTADDLLRQALDVDPADQSAHALLHDLTSDRPLKSASPSLEDTRAKLGDGFRAIETDHFVILTDAEADWALLKGRELERAHDEFAAFCRHLNMQPRPLKHKLVCALFARRSSYERFASRHDAVKESWIAGYYAPLSDRIVFYDVRSSPGLLEAAGQLESMRRELLQVQRQTRDARRRGDREASEHYASLALTFQSHLDGERARVDEFAQRVSTSTTLHESIHQLLFHTRIQHPRVQYPLWISEGLACNFETADARFGFGPDHENPTRRDGFERALRSSRIVPLRDLVQLTEVADEAESAIENTYHQCTALVRWLYRARRDELRAYLELMQRETAGRPTPSRHLEVFEQAFGDVDQLEATWLKLERSRLRSNLATP